MGIICFFGTTITENYRITLYTTLGVFEKVTRNRRDFTFLLELNEASSLEVNIGIGIGITAEGAANNAKVALEFATQRHE
jgi:GTP cyclohydrolase III